MAKFFSLVFLTIVLILALFWTVRDVVDRVVSLEKLVQQNAFD